MKLKLYCIFSAARLALAQGISLSVTTGPGAPGTETENSQEGSNTKVNGDDSASPDNKQTSMEVDNDDSKVCECRSCVYLCQYSSTTLIYLKRHLH